MGDGYIILGVRKHKVSDNKYNNISNYANHKRVGILTITTIILANTLIPIYALSSHQPNVKTSHKSFKKCFFCGFCQ